MKDRRVVRGILADALDGPAGVAPMTGCHVLRYGRVLVVAAHALMRGDPLTLVENLDGAGSEAHLDLGADEAMRDAVVMRLDLDVIVDADPADPPLGEHAGNSFSAGRSISSSSLRGVTPSRRIGRSSLSRLSISAIAALTSARLWKIRWRSRPSSQRSTISTACSTLALSRGRRGLAGRMAVPEWAA